MTTTKSDLYIEESIYHNLKRVANEVEFKFREQKGDYQVIQGDLKTLIPLEEYHQALLDP
jgi:hypothetical protein